ncbi:MAG: hypothetical protein SO046_03195 [Actinomyces urogenitalis]|uniref:hypothetical protein n=1 Tax=Actinomyces urogenitalis TaxID=103621 RepID=UPI002A7F8EA8|nr:hypothetical protein [Actinomyces urogenitalis]MDY3678211.1 hypothetical protein [Actinomyces urogenitalis]
MGRNLTAQERAVIEAMIARADGDSSEQRPSAAQGARWAAALERTTVDHECGCGLCPTIDLAWNGQEVDCEGDRVVLEAFSAGDEMVLLFVDGDLPSCLEVVPNDDQPAALPLPEEIRPARWLPAE